MNETTALPIDVAAPARASTAGPAGPQGRSLRNTLLLPAVVMLLLLALAGAVLVFTQWEVQRDSSESSLRDAADRLSLIVERELNVEQSMLEALSLSHSIDRQDWATHRILAERIAARRQDGIVALADASGQILYNTSRPPGAPLPNLAQIARENRTELFNGEALPVSSQDTAARARETGTVAYSNLYFGLTIKRPSLALAVPVQRNGTTPYTLIFAFTPDTLNAAIGADAGMRPYRLLVVDRNGRVIAASADAQAMLSRTVPQPLRTLVDPAVPPFPDRSARTMAYLGSGEMTVTARSIEATGWTAMAAVSPQTVYGPAQRAAVGWVVATLAVLTVGWLLALRVSHRIAQPLAVLTERAHGRTMLPWPVSDVREIRSLTQALQDAERTSEERNAAVLERRVAEARADEARQAEREVRERETQLRLALLAGRLGFWRLDVTDGVVTGDRLFRDAWGLDEGPGPVPVEDLIGMATDRERERVRAFFSSKAETQGRRSLEKVAIQTRGGRRWLALWGDVLFDPEERQAGLIGVAADITERVLEGEQLGDRNMQLGLAMDSALAIAFDWDIAADRVRRWESREPALPQTPGEPFAAVLAMVYPEDRAPFQARVRDALQSAEGAYRAEFRLQRPDGDVRWLSESGRVLRDSQGRPLRLVGVSFDITEQKRLMLQLEEGRERYQHVLGSIEQSFSLIEVIRDTDGRPTDYRFLETNPAFERATGLRDVAGKTAREVLPQIEPFWIDLLAEVELSGDPARLETSSRVYGDRTFAIEAVRVGRPAAYRVAVLVAETTERRRAEARLRDSEQRYRLMFQDHPHPMWVFDTETLRFLEVNQAAVAHYGYSREEFAAMTITDIRPQDDVPRLLHALDGEVRAGVESSVGWRHVRKDGSVIAVEISSHAFEYDGRRAQLVLALDVTERQRFDEELRRADRQKDEFLATLAHELRNPLAPIRNVTQLLEMNPSQEVVARGTQILRRQVRQMSRLLDDLLDVSRLTLKLLRLQTQPLDLHDVIADAVEQSRPLLESARQTLALRLPSEPVLVQGDRERLAQVLSNLLNNAARYSAGPAAVEVSLQVSDGSAELRVRDQGVGIAPEDLPRIFGMLVQGQSSYQTGKGGLGIGLALARGLVELHGGSVEARSEGAGQGAEFIVRLPVLPPVPAAIAPGLDAPAPWISGHGERVLVVDDNVDSADSMALLLSSLGYSPRTAYNGLDALETARTFAPAVALLDIGLPDIDGLEVARRLKASGWGERIHCIALSGWGQAEDRRRSAEAGVEAHLTKPADPAQLRSVLERVLMKG